MKSIPSTTTGKEALWRITEPANEKVMRLLFHRYPNREWGTFFRFGYRRCAWGMLITWVDELRPVSRDLDRTSPVVEFRAAYIRRALESLESSDLGIGVIHSHPQACTPFPSASDDDMDAYFAEQFEQFGNRPYASLIVSRTPDRKLSFSGRVFDRGNWLQVSSCITVGEYVRREHSVLSTNRVQAPHSQVQQRVADLLGAQAPSRLQQSVIGVVGCNGTGTPAIHVLARAEVGTLVLVDPGRLKPSGHQRNHASKHTDLHLNPLPLKVELAARLVSEISPATQVKPFESDLLLEEVLDELVRCDFILGCTDSNYARAALGDIAAHYLVPVLDLAVLMRADEGVLTDQMGEIARYGPFLPCPWCRGRISIHGIRFETSTEEEGERQTTAAKEATLRGIDGAMYWGGPPPPELTTGYLTTIVGAMGAGYVQNLLQGSGKLPANRFQFDIGRSEFAFVDDNRSAKMDCGCQTHVGLADQARGYRSVSVPSDWMRPPGPDLGTGDSIK
jgi:hypothetical protein